MFGPIKRLEQYAIFATDGLIGHVRDVYFDDHSWVVRYLVVETGSWLLGQRLLISPISVTGVNAEERVLTLHITRQQVKDSPDFDTDKPISRRHESSLLRYYGYPCYWGTGGLWGTGCSPSLLLKDYARGTAISTDRADIRSVQQMGVAGSDPDVDSHLRSCSAVTGYRVEGADGPIGQVKDFLMEGSTWAIRYLVVNISKWWSDHDALVAVRWINDVRWKDNTVTVALTCQAVKDSPAYDPDRALDHAAEVALFKCHGKTSRWDDLELRSPSPTTPGRDQIVVPSGRV